MSAIDGGEVPAATGPGEAAGAPAPESGGGRSRIAVAVLAALVVASAVVTAGAMRQTSTTFDEILLPSAGARGYRTGAFDLVIDHPPLLQYVYGLPVFLSGPRFPDESAGWGYRSRYGYAQSFYWRSGNDPERIAWMARLAAVAMAALLVVLVFAFTRRRWGDGPALVAAGLTAFLPDVLAHGGISYNDVPMALVYFGGAWSLERAARRPAVTTGAVAGVVCGLALAVKFSALALAPVAAGLLVAEAAARDDARAYLRRVTIRVLPFAVLGAYLATVAAYRGDFALTDFRRGMAINIAHAEQGHGAPAYLLGDFSADGWWYFFPVVFLLKTPAALHVLTALAVLGGVEASRSADGPGAGGAGRLRALRARLARSAGSDLRMPAVAFLVFLAFLLRADLNIGFRHALPALPLLLVMVAVGVGRVWATRGRAVRWVIGGLLAWYAVSGLSFYPHFIPYTSEYVPGGDRGHEALVDSSLDWGQGLLELRGFMEEEGIDRIYLSYFGSALPGGYGIDYVPLRSFFPLPGSGSDPTSEPEYVAISATNLVGNYLRGDPFAEFREYRPDRILGHVISVYRVR